MTRKEGFSKFKTYQKRRKKIFLTGTGTGKIISSHFFLQDRIVKNNEISWLQLDGTLDEMTLPDERQTFRRCDGCNLFVIMEIKNKNNVCANVCVCERETKSLNNNHQ